VFKTGMLDADMTGPSIPRLFGIEGLKGESDGEKLFPLEADQGIKIISVNMFLPDEAESVIWRGLLLSGVLKQFYQDVAWEEMDYLVVDFPPGTSDMVLRGFHQLPLDGVVVVVTPQDFVSMIVSWYKTPDSSSQDSSSQVCMITLKIENTGKSTISAYTVSLSAKTDIRTYYRTISESFVILPGKSAYIDVGIEYTSNTEILAADGLSIVDEYYQ